jgi:flagellar motor switch protein FliM
MESTPRQEKIDTLAGAASEGQRDGGQRKETRSIKPCTFRQSGQLSGEEVAAVSALHEGFARSLTQSLGAYLRVALEINLTSVEQLAYSEFLKRIPEVTYVMCIRVEHMSAPAAVQIDQSLVFPLIDILLGGTGLCEIVTREVSEIEEQIMEGVAKIICRELETAWTVLGAKLNLDGRQPHAQTQRFLPPAEKTLCLSFKVKLAETNGMLNLVFPVSISNPLLRKLSADSSYGKPRRADQTHEQMTAKMLDCSFPIELGITAIKLPFHILAGLTTQSVCNLGSSVRKPASLVISGREAFDATPVRRGNLRAAQLGQSLAFSEEERKR